jgi:hypothetical protein
MTQKIFHLCFLNLLLLQMSIVMVFLAPPPLAMVFLIYILPVHPNLHCILKYVTYTCCLFNHFHFLATSCLMFLPMNIGLLCSSLINILLGIMNKPYNCSLSVWLTIDCLQELVTSCSQNLNQTFISLWHRLCILDAQYPTLTL